MEFWIKYERPFDDYSHHVLLIGKQPFNCRVKINSGPYQQESSSIISFGELIQESIEIHNCYSDLT